MTYRGTVANGVVVLDRPIELPDGTEVEVRPLAAPKACGEAEGHVPTLAERLAPFIGCLDGLPSDLAENHDHYLYGLPKKSHPSEP